MILLTMVIFIYSNKNLSFGIVDLGLFPNAAEKFGISVTGNPLNKTDFDIDQIVYSIQSSKP